MQHSFFQRFFMTVMAGIAAASLLWVYRHFVAEAIYEQSDAGYRDSFLPTPVKKK